MEKKLLLVEDDFLVANMLGLMLSKSGFCCDHASSEVEALKFFNSSVDSEKPYDLIIVDLVLGENAVAGARIMKEIRKKQPEVKGVLCSGYTVSPIVEHYKEHGFDYCLNKPFSWESLKAFLYENFHCNAAC